LRRLRTPWLLLHDVDDRDEPAYDDKSGLHLVSRKSAAEPELGYEDAPSVFWLAPVSDPLHEFALAAASSSPSDRSDVWVVERDALKLVGELGIDWQRGFLIFVVGAVSMHHARRLRLHVLAAGKKYTSEPFVPAKDTTVALADGVMTAEVEKLGAEVVS
jgi:hypothetical protein